MLISWKLEKRKQTKVNKLEKSPTTPSPPKKKSQDNNMRT